MILGIDIDTRKLTLCRYDGEEREPMFATAELRSDRRGQAFLDSAAAVVGAVSAAINSFPAVHEAYIERGWGANRVADFQLGVVFGAVAVALPRVRPGIHVGQMTTHEWKRAVTAAIGITTKRGQPGNANAPKEQANAACRILLTELGEAPERIQRLTPDELDAFGIAWTAAHR